MHVSGLGSISKNLALLVIVAVLPALFILLSASMEQRRHSIEAARQNVLFLTHSMVEVQKRITSSTKQTLSTMALASAIQTMAAGAASAILSENIPHHLGRLPATHGAGTPCLNFEGFNAATCAVYSSTVVFISLLVS
jgi:hypothetical protein